MSDDVIVTGPLFDGQAEAAMDEYLRRMPRDIAQKGQQMARDHLGSVLRQDRGVYVSRVYVREEGDDVVIGNDMVYSPWLEGTSRRNNSTSFGGYHTFEITGRDLDSRAEEMAEEILQPYLEEMR